MYGDITLKISTVFADQTRSAIYRHILEDGKDGYSVKEIAEAFSIHPNVARLHLTKLEEIGLLESRSQKGALAGRPCRSYRPKAHALTLTFPPRDYQLLSALALEALAEDRAEGLERLQRVGSRFGRQLMEQRRPDEGFSIEMIKNIFSEQGLCPEMQNNYGEKKGTMQITFRNCSFLEMALRYPQQVCTLHKAMIHGMLEAAFGQSLLQMGSCLASGGKTCSYIVTLQEVPHERRVHQSLHPGSSTCDEPVWRSVQSGQDGP